MKGRIKGRRAGRRLQLWIVCASAALQALVLWQGRLYGDPSLWQGPGTDWNTAGNWNPAGVPNSSSAAVIFGDTGAGTVNLSSPVALRSITFSNDTGSYQLSSNAAQAITGITNITVGADVSGFDVIDLSSNTTGSLQFLEGSNLTIANNSMSSGYTLEIGSTTVIGTSGYGGVVFQGAGYTTFDGTFADGADAVVGGLVKNGPGILDYAGDGTNLYGGIQLNGGMLILDYSSNVASKIASSSSVGLVLQGGILELNANATTPVTQVIPDGTDLYGGHTNIVSAGSGTISLQLGAIGRSAGATLDIAPSASFTVTTLAGNTNGLLGTGPAYATISGGSTWATVSSGTITGLSVYSTNDFESGANTDITNDSSIGNMVTNSLRFNTGSLSLVLSGTATLQSGGVLVTANAASATIFGGTLTAPSGGELVFHVYSSGGLTVESSLVSTIGLTKTGPGTLTLSGSNTGLTGPININRGSLAITTTAAVNSASQINFNDDETSSSDAPRQTFTVDLGNGVSGTVSPPITLSAFGANNYGTFFTSGSSIGSTITLSGVISSAPGLTTPIRFGGDPSNSSGFNLTNTDNSFTGNISLWQGALGITSDAVLGNPANILYLETGDENQGGLIFLNTGVDVSHNVVLTYNSRVVSNGTDNNVISGIISGDSVLIKAGTGTLDLLGANTYSSGTIFDGGTVGIGNDSALAYDTVHVNVNTNLFAQQTNHALANSITITTSESLTIVDDPNGANNLTLTGKMTGSGSLVMSGTAALTLSSSTSNYTGGTTLNSGEIIINNNNALGAGPITLNGGTITATSDAIINVAYDDRAATSPITFRAAPGATLTLGNIAYLGSETLNFGSAGDTGTVNFSPGAWIFTNATWNINGGTLFNGDGALTSMLYAMTVTIAQTAKVDLNNSSTAFGNLLGGGTLATGTNLSETFTLTAANFSGNITGNGKLITTGNTVILSGLNSYSGGSTFGGGTVGAGNDSALGGGQVTVTANTNLYAQGAAHALANPIAINGGESLTITDDPNGANALTLSGAISGSGAIVMSGTSSLTLSSSTTNYGGGTTLNSGEIIINNNNSLGTGPLTLNGGTITATSDAIINVTSDDNAATSPVTFQAIAGTTLTLGATMHLGPQTLNFGSAVNTGTVNFSPDALNFTNAQWNINGGTLFNGDGGLTALLYALTVTIAPSTTLDLNSGSTTIGNLLGAGTLATGTDSNETFTLSAANFSGNITGSGQLLVSGNTVTLSGASTYAGGSTISGGTLLVNNTTGSATGSGAVTLNGGTLGGSGVITGNVIAGAAAHTIAPSANLTGNTATKLTLGSLSTNNNTTLAFNLKTPGPSSVNDQIIITGSSALTLNGGTITIPNSSTGAASLGYYKIIQYAGGIAGSGISSITLPTISNNIAYILDITHDLGYIDLHRGFLGDSNDDGIVNAIDLGILATNYNSTTANWSTGDYNGDGIVNAIDLGILATNYNAVARSGSFDSDVASYPALVSAAESLPYDVPEPATLALLSVGVAALIFRKPRG